MQVCGDKAAFPLPDILVLFEFSGFDDMKIVSNKRGQFRFVLPDSLDKLHFRRCWIRQKSADFISFAERINGMQKNGVFWIFWKTGFFSVLLVFSLPLERANGLEGENLDNQRYVAASGPAPGADSPDVDGAAELDAGSFSEESAESEAAGQITCPDPSTAGKRAALCKEKYRKARSFCTEEGLSKLNMANALGQSAAGGLAAAKAGSEKPGSAKKAMEMASKISYGMGVVNAAIGVKCLSNVKGCMKICNQASNEMSQCNMNAFAAPLYAAQSLKILSGVSPEEKTTDCASMKTAAYAALAQGALFGLTGLGQKTVAEKLGDGSEDKENEGDASPPQFQAAEQTNVILGDGDDNSSSEDQGIGSVTGNLDNPPTPPPDSGDSDDIAYEDSGAYAGSSGFGGPQGAHSQGSHAGVGSLAGSSGLGAGGLPKGEGKGFYIANRRFGSPGGGGRTSGLYGSGAAGGGLFDRAPSGGKRRDAGPLEKEKEKLKKLKNSISGKHENIFDKASKIITAYCRKGALKCR